MPTPVILATVRADGYIVIVFRAADAATPLEVREQGNNPHHHGSALERLDVEDARAIGFDRLKEMAASAIADIKAQRGWPAASTRIDEEPHRLLDGTHITPFARFARAIA